MFCNTQYLLKNKTQEGSDLLCGRYNIGLVCLAYGRRRPSILDGIFVQTFMRWWGKIRGGRGIIDEIQNGKGGSLTNLDVTGLNKKDKFPSELV